MANRWSGVTIDCADPIRMSTFWAAVLGIPASSEHGDDPAWATVGSRAGRFPRLTFQRVAEPKAGKVRIHLDVEVDEIAPDVVRSRNWVDASPASGMTTTRAWC
ncbi:VOC family protein [Mycolicibacterium sp. XJ775]